MTTSLFLSAIRIGAMAKGFKSRVQRLPGDLLSNRNASGTQLAK